MKKVIILTASIIRGDFHEKTIGKFYEFFANYFSDYEIIHIINIDEPVHLRKFFNRYETMFNYNKIIPKQVNKIYINEPNPGFLDAYKKIIAKIEELNLIDDDYFYYWLEDDWEPKSNYNICKFIEYLNFKNTAFTFSNNCPLGSFRGAPFMTGSYFKNVFNIKNFMNTTCDPERQMQRWIRGGYNKNGNSFINRMSIENTNIDNKYIHIIFISPDNININIEHKLHIWNYKSPPFDPAIKFQFHVLIYDSQFNFEYSRFENNKTVMKPVNKTYLHQMFNDLSIKYCIIEPVVFSDEWLGRKFTEKYGLKKWANITDGTSYSIPTFYNGQLGNWKLMKEEDLRYKPSYTMNKGFFSAIAYFHICLPYLEQHYFNKGINLNLLYYSHNYGNYPNFQVIGDLLQLNYVPSLNSKNVQFGELSCLAGLSRNKNPFNGDFKLAHDTFFKYFKFDISITDETMQFCEQFKNKKVLGLHFRGTDKMKSKWVCHISDNEFIQIIEDHMENNKYDIIFISTDENIFIEKMKQKFQTSNIIYYDETKNEENKNPIHLNQLSIIEKKIAELKKNKSNLEKTIHLENQLKKETQLNRFLLKNVIVNSFILSKCNLVLKTQSQVSAYSKVFNPDLQIYRVNGFAEKYWPDSHIPLYDYENIKNLEIKNLIHSKLKGFN
jgi:hypothetical protein